MPQDIVIKLNGNDMPVIDIIYWSKSRRAVGQLRVQGGVVEYRF